MSPIFVQLLLHHHLLLLLFYLNNQGPNVIEYPRTWLMLSLTNFGVEKGKSFRSHYTRHVGPNLLVTSILVINKWIQIEMFHLLIIHI
jgi:hypothetical protein